MRARTSARRDRPLAGLRAVALFEAAKGLVAFLGGSGLLLLVHRNVQAAADLVAGHFHLNPASRYPRIFLRVASEATPGRLKLIALGAFVYSVLRFVEAAGLWRGKRWAEWFGVVSGIIYIPFEVRALVQRPGPEPLIAFLLNLGIVIYLGLRLRSGTKSWARSAAPGA